MKVRRIILTSAITLALALGLWTLAAVDFAAVTSSFDEGDVLRAADLNGLFQSVDANFQDAEVQINQNVTDIGSLQTGKVDAAGDAMSGRLGIAGDTGASSATPDGAAAALSVENSNASGVSAVVRNQSDRPALYLEQNGTGAILEAVGDTGSVRVQSDGDIELQGGTVKNEAGQSLLPAAFGKVSETGTLSAGTSNVANVERTALGTYTITFDDSIDITSQAIVSLTLVAGHRVDETASYYTDAAGNNNIVVNIGDQYSYVDRGFTFVLQHR